MVTDARHDVLPVLDEGRAAGVLVKKTPNFQSKFPPNSQQFATIRYNSPHFESKSSDLGQRELRLRAPHVDLLTNMTN